MKIWNGAFWRNPRHYCWRLFTEAWRWLGVVFHATSSWFVYFLFGGYNVDVFMYIIFTFFLNSNILVIITNFDALCGFYGILFYTAVIGWL